MNVYLIHHAEALTIEQDPLRHLSPTGRDQADRLGTRLRALGVAPVRILHSDKQWTIETAQRIAAQLGIEDRTTRATYPINTGDPVAPFMAEIAAARGDIMMCVTSIICSVQPRNSCAGTRTRRSSDSNPATARSSVSRARPATGSSPTCGARITHRGNAPAGPNDSP